MSKRRTFVVLEDRFEDRFFLCRAIRESFPDAEIEEFAYSEEAFAYLKQHPDHANVVVFVDVKLPGIDGTKFIELCHDELYANIDARPTFIAMSAVVGPEEKQAIESDERVKAFLPKPIIRDALEALVRG